MQIYQDCNLFVAIRDFVFVGAIISCFTLTVFSYALPVSCGLFDNGIYLPNPMRFSLTKEDAHGSIVERFLSAWKIAGIAQSVEQLICNQQVGGSSPSAGSNQTDEMNMGEFPSGQRGQTVNLLRLASVVRIRPSP